MKTTETINYKDAQLTVFVDADEHDKATVSYFINGYEVTDWSKIKPSFQALLTAIADDICKTYSLTKWSY